METNLLPCPFCGGNARLTIWTPNAASISCIFCGAHFNVNTKAEAIEHWNTRHERTCRYKHIEGTWFKCECGEWYDGVIEPNYCPSCGAKVVRK